MATNRRINLIWIVLVVVGVLFLGKTAGDLVNPATNTNNPYNYLELYTETPWAATFNYWIDLFLGLFGVLSIITIEFAFGRKQSMRCFESPVHFFNFGAVCIGFLLLAISSFRLIDLLPDLAHYYYARSGELKDIAALTANSIKIDREGWFLFGGSGLWTLHFSLEGLSKKTLPKVLVVAGLLLGVTLIGLLVLMLMDSGMITGVVSLVVTAILAPFWFIGLGLYLRRRHSDAE